MKRSWIGSLILALTLASVEKSRAQTSTETIAVRFSNAKDLFKKSQTDEAILQLKRVVEEAPLYYPAVYELTREFLILHRRSDAIQLLQESIARTPDPKLKADFRARQRIIGIQFVSHQTFELYQSGVSLLELKKFKESESKLTQALNREPPHFLIRLRLGQLHALKQDWNAALSEFDRARETLADEPELLLWRGFVLLRQKQFVESETLLKRAQAKLPESELIPLWLSEMASLRGQPEAAVSLLETDLQSNPVHVMSLLSLAKLRGDPMSARQDLQLALSRLESYRQQLERGGFEGEAGLSIFSLEELKQNIQTEIDANDQKIKTHTS